MEGSGLRILYRKNLLIEDPDVTKNVPLSASMRMWRNQTQET